MNLVFTSGAFAYYMLALPELIPLIDVLLVMLFTLIINQGANEYIQAEKANVRLMKTIPISETLQIFIKVSVPFVLSFISLFASIIVLYLSATIALSTAIFSLILTTILLLIFEVVSLREELAIRHTKPRSNLLSSFYSYALPVLYFACSVFCCAKGFSLQQAFLVGIVVFILMGIPYFYRIKSKTAKKFLDLEMVN
jgi:hypothetical protein